MIENITPYVITISRQLGSGGAYIGQRLSARLSVLYMDRDILRQAARKFNVSEEMLASRDESAMSVWDSLLQSFAFITPGSYYAPPPIRIPMDTDIYREESEIIRRAAEEKSAIFVGRGGHHVLREHPRHLSVFLHANIVFRAQRCQEMYQASAKEAQKMIEESDHARARYVRAHTGTDWTDARQYHLSLDTSQLGLLGAEEVICAALRELFGVSIPAAHSPEK